MSFNQSSFIQSNLNPVITKHGLYIFPLSTTSLNLVSLKVGFLV